PMAARRRGGVARAPSQGPTVAPRRGVGEAAWSHTWALVTSTGVREREQGRPEGHGARVRHRAVSGLNLNQRHTRTGDMDEHVSRDRLQRPAPGGRGASEVVEAAEGLPD